MNNLLKMLNDTGVEMSTRVDSRGVINVEFKKDDWGYRKILDPSEFIFTELTMEDRLIYELNEFLEDLKKTKTNPVDLAYELLVTTYNTKDVTKEDALIAIEEAIGYLGEALE